MKKSIRILLADDHPPLRAGLASILNSQADFTVIAEAGTGREVLAILDTQTADILILDLRMPDGDGIHTLLELKQRKHPIKALILTTYDNEEDIFTALEAGARGYLLKDTTKEELCAAIRYVQEGHRFLPQAIASRLAERMVRPGLTPREFDVLRLVSRGRSNKEIATAMFVSEETVKTHMKSLFHKLDVHDRAEAVSVSMQRGLIRL